MGKKNCELINKELEINELKRDIENLESEKSTLKDNIKHDKAARDLKEMYEGEKWKNLAEISTLKQQNEALKEKAIETEDISHAFKVDYEEMENYKKENAALKKERDDNKKDKKILSLERKVLKAHTEIKKLQLDRGICADNAPNFELEEAEPSTFMSFSKLGIQAGVYILLNARNFIQP